MASQSVLVIGGSGTQGVPIVTELARHEQYKFIRVLTRDPNSEKCRQLASLGKVEFSLGSPEDEPALRKAFAGIDLVFVNTNSWSLGIKNEIYWGIRIYELAVQAGVKHFIWSSLDNFGFDTKFDEELRVGHYYGKGHVEQWLSSIPQREDSTRWSILTTGPYMQLISKLLRPSRDEQGVYTFEAPLADGSVPFIDLDDLGVYVHWMFSNIDESAGMNLKVAIEPVSYDYLAATFTKVTGKPAVYRDITFEEYFNKIYFKPIAEKKLGTEVAGDDDPTLLSYRENFTAFWMLYQRSRGNEGILRRDYELLDRIFPGRVRTVAEWMRKVNPTGDF